MEKIISPHKYICKDGVLEEGGKLIAPFGRKLFIMGGRTGLEVTRDRLLEGITEAGLEVMKVEWYGGECSTTNIQALSQQAVDCGADLVVGIGGGKALDTAKAVAYETHLPVVIIPTIASTCAPWTPLSVLYTDDGQFVNMLYQSANPCLVLVEPEIIAQAPVRYLTAGIGDTIAKWYELEIAARNKVKDVSTSTGLVVAKLCKDVLLEYGEAATSAVLNKTVDFALRQVIDANIMLGGMVSGLGGADLRTAAAHAIYSGLTVIPELHSMYHGEVVAFGVVCQSALDGQSYDDVEEILRFYTQINLPITLTQMGAGEIGEQRLREAGEVAAKIDDMNNLPFKVDGKMVYDGILTADSWGNQFLQSIE